MTLNKTEFGSKCVFSDKFLKDLIKTDLIEQIIFNAEMKMNAKMKRELNGKKKRNVLGIDKLEDANKAGTQHSGDCYLILTEGDSAKSLAMAGIEIVGRDYYGVFPLKGKLINVRDASSSVLLKNQEIQNLMKITGLKIGEKYSDLKSLRYGKILIMTDQDVDGSHIKGLIINFIAHFWKSLITDFNFVSEFVTPIIKCFKGN